MREIIEKWVGKRADYDNAYGYQCVDWARTFAKELGAEIKSFSGSALNGWRTGSPFAGTDWKRVWIGNGIPQDGDIVFFDKTSANPYGHVAVSYGSTKDALQIVEQNAGSGNGDGKNQNAIRISKRSYKSNLGNCLGWFHLPTTAERSVNAWIWNGKDGERMPTRFEASSMILRASGKNAWEVWNGTNAGVEATQFEINEMLMRAFKFGAVIQNRRQLAEFCFLHKNIDKK